MFSSVRHEISAAYWIIYMSGHVVLTLLNAIWLTKMIRSLRKRFEGDDKKPILTPTNGQPLPANYTDTNPVQGAA
ncbi:hypothetical protein EW026_g4303 [Hermanssonia centrifuga]|uniref:TLC domain-containing protein n=1 Tax=Hermanssonia centrifuga TaxID=98765 RepID=A0A4S4KM43_9APHY|nr:hypothetical protein EW026_g4303 [Hermanssonia centrifuga]